MKILILILFLLPNCLSSQIDSNLRLSEKDSSQNISFFEPSQDFSKRRFYYAGGLGALAYTSFSVGFYNAWYKDFPMSRFKLFNDYGEWENMDKAGHIFSGYFQALLTYKGAKWTGLSENKSIWTGIACGTLFQTTLEVMDGFSQQWGFSIPDIASNTIGIGTFAIQQRYWGEQRITLKESAWASKHASDIFINSINGIGPPVSLRQRADQLYGSSWGERFLKDYNAQTYWASINVKSFLDPSARWPNWLNIALGYSAENMYGGFENTWSTNGIKYDASSIERYHQFVVALDLDFTKIRTRHGFLRSLLSIGNIFKMPSPAIEFTSQGEVMFHLIYF